VVDFIAESTATATATATAGAGDDSGVAGRRILISSDQALRTGPEMPSLLTNLGGADIRIFNGTNKDDLADHTRVGLVAATEWRVASPLDHLAKAEVRAVARLFGLPNHAHAASPCLRSRLALGVTATPARLRRVEAAEEVARALLGVQVHHNLRVRVLRDNGARVEADPCLLARAQKSGVIGQVAADIAALGFDTVTFKTFRSGSMSATAGAVAWE
jgi:PP-loop superfamily ATP-utilizing enzyme